MLIAVAAVVWAHDWKAPEPQASMKNPLKSNRVNVTAGEKLFQSYCSGCHGEDATGSEDSSPDPDSMVPPNLVKRLKSHSEGGFFWKIQTGRNDMPSFQDELDEKEIWQIVIFLRRLPN